MVFHTKHISLATAVVAAAMLSGCGSSDDNSTTSSTSSSAMANASSEASSSMAMDSSSSAASSSEASVDIAALVALGKTAYEAQCVGCHGADGTGNTAINLTDGPADLASYIEANMPKAGNGATPADCDADCAEQVAAYINSWDDEAFTLVSAPMGYTIESITNCGVDAAMESNATAIFNASTNSISGWSHVSTDSPYDGLAMSGDSALYDVPGVTASDSSCNDTNTQKVVLVKKYANWAAQHSNGIEVSIADQNKTFSDVDKIVFDFKVNNDSVILSKAELMGIYGDTLTDVQYDELDQGKATFAVSVLAPTPVPSTDPDIETEPKVQTCRYIEIDQTVLADQWIRVTIPFAEMDMFTGEVWEKTPTTIAVQASTLADRIQINPEVLGTKTANTTYGDVIRNFLGGPNDDDWAALNIPESFKELSISIKNVEVHWK